MIVLRSQVFIIILIDAHQKLLLPSAPILPPEIKISIKKTVACQPAKSQFSLKSPGRLLLQGRAFAEDYFLH